MTGIRFKWRRGSGQFTRPGSLEDIGAVVMCPHCRQVNVRDAGSTKPPTHCTDCKRELLNAPAHLPPASGGKVPPVVLPIS